MTRTGELQIGCYDHETGENQSYNLKRDWGIDGHNVGSFLVLPNKNLMIFYAMHGEKGLYCRRSKRPESITSWGEEITIAAGPGITYNHPVYLSDEKKFYVFWRGSEWKPTFAKSSDGIVWGNPKVLIQDETYLGPYVKIVSDGKSTIHFAFTDGHPRDEPQNSIYYLRYENGQFFKADGNLAGTMSSLPMHCAKGDLVYDGKTANVRSWLWDIALDKQGYPVIAYTRFPEEKDHRYCYARWMGQKWLDVEVAQGGSWFPQTPIWKKERETHYSGGMAIDHSNPNVLYLSRQINGVFEIERWESLDNGRTWISQAITENSRYNNVRPVVPQRLYRLRKICSLDEWGVHALYKIQNLH